MYTMTKISHMDVAVAKRFGDDIWSRNPDAVPLGSPT